MILHLYFARRYATTFLFVAAIFFGIILLVDLVDQVRRFEGSGISFPGIVGLTLLSAPQTIYTILPLLVIVTTLALFLNLSRTSELVVTRASGRSAFRSLIGPVVVTLLIGALAVAALNPISASTARQYDLMAERLSGGGGSALSVGSEGIWLRQRGETGQIVIQARRADENGTVLRGVSFFGFDGIGDPTTRIEARTARLEPGQWILGDAKTWDFSTPNAEASARRIDRMTVPTSLTAERILHSFGDPATLGVWNLPAFIDDLREAGFSAQRHTVYLQMQLSLPVLLVAMMLVGAAFTMRHSRVSRTGLMVLLALTLGFTLFFIRNFAQILGEEGQIPVLLAAWGPPVAAVLLPIGLLLHWEDG